MENYFNRKIVKGVGVVCVTVGALTAGLGAHAASDDYVVSSSHTELTSAKGVEDVHARIVKAAKQYCPSYSQIRSHAEVRLCVDGVVEDLVSKVAHPTLTSLHESGSAINVAGAVPGAKAERS